MEKLVVSDTTAITHLAKIGALNILQLLYNEILIPEAVYSELSQVKRTQPGALQVLNSSWIKVVPIKNRTVLDKLLRHLDLGESEAIALSIELQSDVLIIDEIAGRSVAKKLGRNIIGMVGVLLEAKKNKYIKSVRPYLDNLRKTGFRLGEDLYQLALKSKISYLLNNQFKGAEKIGAYLKYCCHCPLIITPHFLFTKQLRRNLETRQALRD